MLRGRGKARLIVVGMLLVGAAGYYGGRLLWAGRHYRQALEAAERRDFSCADDHLQRALGMAPNDSALHLLAARSARRQGDMDRAAPHLQVCARQGAFPDEVAIEYRLWQLQSGELDEAPAFLQRTRDQPDVPETPLIQEALIQGCLADLTALANRGFTKVEVAAQPELIWALEAADAWLQRRLGAAEQIQGLVWRGRLREMAGEHMQAVADLRQAVQRAPEQFEPLWYLATTIGQEAPAEAAEHLAALAQRFPDKRLVRLMLALSRRWLGQLDEARQILDELLAADATDVGALVERGRLALDAAQPAEAETWLRRAEAVAPAQIDVLLNLDRTLRLLGRTEEARRYQERFREAEAAQKRQRDQRSARVKSMRSSAKDR